MPRKGDNITKRKDGRWEARIKLKINENGKSKYKFVYGKTYTEAKLKKEQEQSRLYKGQIPLIKSYIFFSKLVDEFFIYKQNTIKDSTFSHYVYLIKKYVLTYFDEYKIANINTFVIENFTNKLLKESNLSKKTVRDILSVRYLDIYICTYHLYCLSLIFCYLLNTVTMNQILPNT